MLFLVVLLEPGLAKLDNNIISNFKEILDKKSLNVRFDIIGRDYKKNPKLSKSDIKDKVNKAIENFKNGIKK